eukprot:g29499.t1
MKAFNEAEATFAKSLTKMKQEAPDTPDLLYALEEGPEERSWALQLLSAIVESQPDIGRQLMPQVLAALEDDAASVQLAAIDVLAKLKATEHLPQILDFLADPNAQLRSASAECMGNMDAWHLAEELRPSLADSDGNVVKSALKAARSWGENGQMLASAVVRCLDHANAGARCEAVQVLTSCAEASERFAGKVAKLLANPDLQTREAAVAFFAALGPRGTRRALAETQKLLKDPIGQCAAAMALGHMKALNCAAEVASLLTPGQDSALALAATGLEPRLGVELRRPECAAAFALSLMGDEGGKYADSIASLLSDKQLPTEATASLIRSLASMGSYASGHKGKLLSFLEHPQSQLREAACWAFGAFGALLQEEGIDMLLALLNDSQATVRQRAAKALGHLQESSLYVDHLAVLLDDPVPAVQAQALESLASCGEEAESYAAIVCRMAVEHSREGHSGVRCSALKTLGNMRAADFAEEVAGCFEDSDPLVRAAAAEALAHFGAEGKEFLMQDSSAASKVAQVQELMRQRLQAVQDEQQRQWHEIQLALNGQLHAAKEAAEEAVRREFGEVMQGQAAEMQNLRKALSDMMQSQRATEEHAGRQVDALAGELADARAAIQRFEAETGGWQSQIRSLNHAVEELARAKQEQAAHQDAAHRELAEARSAMQRLQLQSDDFQSRLQSQAQEMERLRAEKQECAREHEACARDRALLSQRLQDVEGILNELRGQLREHGLEIDRLKVAHQECVDASEFAFGPLFM